MIANVCNLSNTGGNLGSGAIPGVSTTADYSELMQVKRAPERATHRPGWVIVRLLAI